MINQSEVGSIGDRLGTTVIDSYDSDTGRGIHVQNAGSPFNMSPPVLSHTLPIAHQQPSDSSGPVGVAGAGKNPIVTGGLAGRTGYIPNPIRAVTQPKPLPPPTINLPSPNNANTGLQTGTQTSTGGVTSVTGATANKDGTFSLSPGSGADVIASLLGQEGSSANSGGGAAGGGSIASDLPYVAGQDSSSSSGPNSSVIIIAIVAIVIIFGAWYMHKKGNKQHGNMARVGAAAT